MVVQFPGPLGPTLLKSASMVRMSIFTCLMYLDPVSPTSSGSTTAATANSYYLYQRCCHRQIHGVIQIKPSFCVCVPAMLDNFHIPHSAVVLPFTSPHKAAHDGSLYRQKNCLKSPAKTFAACLLRFSWNHHGTNLACNEAGLTCP